MNMANDAMDCTETLSVGMMPSMGYTKNRVFCITVDLMVFRVF